MPNNVLQTAGVYVTEIDDSQFIITNSTTILGLVGLAPKGTVDDFMLSTSVRELQNNNGIPSESYPALLVAREFLTAGGEQVLFVRVTDGSDEAATISATSISGSQTYVFTAPETGSYYNNVSVAISYGSQRQTTYTHAETFASSGTTPVTLTLPNVPVVPGTVVVGNNNLSLWATDDGAGNLVFITGFTAYSGTVNYSTGAVTITSVAPGSNTISSVILNANYYSTFNVQTIYTAVDSDSVLVSKNVLETFQNLTLSNVRATLANSAFIDFTTTSPSTGNPAQFPVAGTYVLAAGTDGSSTINDADYIGNVISSPTGLQVLGFPDSLPLNVIGIPGVSSTGIVQALFQMAAEQRQDCLALIDPPAGLTAQHVADWRNATGSYTGNFVLNTSFCSIYFPYYSTENPVTGDIELTPPSAAAAQALARSLPWQAPAGPNRGLLQNVIDVALNLSANDRVQLDENQINTIANLQGMGIQVCGQHTTELVPSSLDRVGARMMLFAIEKAVKKSMFTFLFEPNDLQTWTRVINLVQPYLNSLSDAGQIYTGVVKCDASINTPEIVNNNQMVVQITLQLLKYAEIISLEFVLQPYTGQVITQESTSNNLNN